MEIWKDILGYEGLYQVSNMGRIKSLGRIKINHSKIQMVPERIKSLRKTKQGYLLVDLYKNNIQKTLRVHRIVAEAFIDNAEKKETVNHINGDKSNNKVENLEWATPSEQNFHFYKNKLKSDKNIKKAIKAMNKATSKKVLCLDTNIIYNSLTEAAKFNNISPSTIRKVINGEMKKAAGKKWKYI